MILLRNKIFADKSKVRILTKSHQIRVSPKSNENIPIRYRKGYRDTQGRRPWKNGGRDWSYAATSQGGLEPPEAARGKHAFFPPAVKKGVALVTP